MTAHLIGMLELKFFNFFLIGNFKKQTCSTLNLRTMGHFSKRNAPRAFTPV